MNLAGVLTIFATLFADSEVVIEAGRGSYEGQTINMDESITLTLGEGKELTCQSADYDPEGGCIRLFGSDEVPIHYVDGQVELHCREAALKMSPTLAVSQFDVMGNVRITYDDITATGDRGSYHSGPEGLISLSSDRMCHFTNEKGDQVDAQTITFSRSDRTVTLSSPEGVLATKPAPTYFKGETLTWTMGDEVYTFLGQSTIRQNSQGSLEASQVLKIDKANRTVHAEGQINIELFSVHCLSYEGTLDLDHNSGKVVFDSRNELIAFKDDYAEVHAQRAIARYQGARPPRFEQLRVEGGVRIVSYLSYDATPSSTVLHTILADTAELDLKEHKLALRADNGKRALLYDHVNHLQVSAPGMQVSRDKKTHKDKIQGFGDVRFSFTEQELERLKQQFLWIN